MFREEAKKKEGQKTGEITTNTTTISNMTKITQIHLDQIRRTGGPQNGGVNLRARKRMDERWKMGRGGGLT